MTKRKTRASNVENDTNISLTDLPKQKRSSGKSTSTNKLLFDEQSVVNTLVDEPTFTVLEPVSFDQHENVSDHENSPPPLIIDLDKEVCSQSVMPGSFPRSELVGERLPFGTSNDSNKRQNYLSITSPRFISDENRSNNNDRAKKERPREENRTPVVDRSTDGQLSSNIRSQPSTSRIVVSVDRRRRDSNEDLNQNHRTSTPIRPSRPPPMNIGSSDDYIDSFSTDSIPQDTYNMLSRFPEFRRLLKCYNSEKKKCQSWAKDYARLQNNYKQLEENSFPRPPAPAMNYLVDLVGLIQQSSGRNDPRSDEQIARALGESYETKVKLASVNTLEINKPGLLETILTFSQRAAPGTSYKLEHLRNCLNNSIRGARHEWNKSHQSVAHAEAILKTKQKNYTELEDGNHLNRNNEYSMGTDNMLMKEVERERRFDDDDCF